MRDEAGNIVKWYGSATDIEDRKRIEAALRQSEERFRDYAETASDWSWRPDRTTLWAAVCLALYIAFWLELDSAYWAGTTAAIVCQPSLGASLRKGSFLMIGTEAAIDRSRASHALKRCWSRAQARPT